MPLPLESGAMEANGTAELTIDAPVVDDWLKATFVKIRRNTVIMRIIRFIIKILIIDLFYFFTRLHA
jgi:hypothetical protein